VGQLLVVLYLIAFKLAPPELIPDPLALCPRLTAWSMDLGSGKMNKA